jgi:hypothetical protein
LTLDLSKFLYTKALFYLKSEYHPSPAYIAICPAASGCPGFSYTIISPVWGV